MTLATRFWSKVDTSAGLFGCWPWIGANDGHGYGQLMGPGRRKVRATRLVVTLFGRPLGDDQDVLHACDNPPCVNPAHLFTGTAADNVRDAILKGRWASIERDRPAVVAEVRRLDAEGLSLRAITRDTGVSRNALGALLGHGFSDRRIARDDRPAVAL